MLTVILVSIAFSSATTKNINISKQFGTINSTKPLQNSHELHAGHFTERKDGNNASDRSRMQNSETPVASKFSADAPVGRNHQSEMPDFISSDERVQENTHDESTNHHNTPKDNRSITYKRKTSSEEDVSKIANKRTTGDSGFKIHSQSKNVGESLRVNMRRLQSFNKKGHESKHKDFMVDYEDYGDEYAALDDKGYAESKYYYYDQLGKNLGNGKPSDTFHSEKNSGDNSYGQYYYETMKEHEINSGSKKGKIKDEAPLEKPVNLPKNVNSKYYDVKSGKEIESGQKLSKKKPKKSNSVSQLYFKQEKARGSAFGKTKVKPPKSAKAGRHIDIPQKGVFTNLTELPMKKAPHHQAFSWDVINSKYHGFRSGFPTSFDPERVLPTDTDFNIKPKVMTWRSWFGHLIQYCADNPPLYLTSQREADCLWDQVLFMYARAQTTDGSIILIDFDQLALAYVLFVCRHIDYPEICPDPCSLDPCKTIEHTVEKCYRLPHAIHPKHFQCDCEKSFKWSPEELGCTTRVDVCSTEGLYPCQKYNSVGCEITDEGVRCLCKPRFMGTYCDRLRDPCEVSEKHKPGNLMCRPGECIPEIGTEKYSCRCPDGEMDDWSDRWPDCNATYHYDKKQQSMQVTVPHKKEDEKQPRWLNNLYDDYVWVNTRDVDDPKSCPKEEALINGNTFNVPDERITATSTYASKLSTSRSRINVCRKKPDCGWAPKDHDSVKEITVDLGKEFLITAIGLQGRGYKKQYVTSFRLFFRNNKKQMVSSDMNGKVMTGTHDDRSIVKRKLDEAVKARFVTLMVWSWSKYPVLRWEVYGCPARQEDKEDPTVHWKCDVAEPLFNGDRFSIPDEKFTSTTYDKNLPPTNSKINTCKRPPDCGWAPQKSDRLREITADLGKEFIITRVSTQGRGHKQDYVTTYRLYFRDEHSGLVESISNGQRFRGNNNDRDVDKRGFSPVRARYVTLRIMTWHDYPVLRWEAFGCPYQPGEVAKAEGDTEEGEEDAADEQLNDIDKEAVLRIDGETEIETNDAGDSIVGDTEKTGRTKHTENSTEIKEKQEKLELKAKQEALNEVAHSASKLLSVKGKLARGKKLLQLKMVLVAVAVVVFLLLAVCCMRSSKQEENDPYENLSPEDLRKAQIHVASSKTSAKSVRSAQSNASNQSEDEDSEADVKTSLLRASGPKRATRSDITRQNSSSYSTSEADDDRSRSKGKKKSKREKSRRKSSKDRQPKKSRSKSRAEKSRSKSPAKKGKKSIGSGSGKRK